MILLYDLIDCARPGEEVEVTGGLGPALPDMHMHGLVQVQRYNCCSCMVVVPGGCGWL